MNGIAKVAIAELSPAAAENYTIIHYYAPTSHIQGKVT